MWEGWSSDDRVSRWGSYLDPPWNNESQLSLYPWQRRILDTGGNRIILGGRQVGRSTAMLMDALYRASQGSRVHVIGKNPARLHRMAMNMSVHVRYAARSDAIIFEGGILVIWSAPFPPGLQPDYIYLDEIGYETLNALYRRGIFQSGGMWMNLECEQGIDNWKIPIRKAIFDYLGSRCIMMSVPTIDDWRII